MGRRGIIALGLTAVLGVAVCLLLGRLGLGRGSSLATVVGLPIALVAMVASVLALKLNDARKPVAGLDTIADEMAANIHDHWDNEAKLRGLHDRELPLVWQSVTEDQDLFEAWPHDPGTVENWPGQPVESSAGRTFRRDKLAGSGDQICPTLARIPTARLVVLGEPGAGKTILLVNLLLQLLREREERRKTQRPAGDVLPVPVLVSLASWNPEQDLESWLLDRLAIDHESLRTPVPGPGRGIGRSSGISCGQALFSKHKLFMILDGLDEVRAKYRGRAIAQINDVLGRHDGVVLACREEEYREAVAPASDQPIKLQRAVGIALQPLDPEHVEDYLLEGAQTETGRRRWAQVLGLLGTGEPLARALRTPLAVTLADAIYNPRRRGEHAPAERHPDELCDSEELKSPDQIQEHLFRTFIKAAYRPHQGPGAKSRRQHNPDRAERWLTYLACHLYDRKATQLAWWELPKAAPPWLPEIVIGLICGIAGGIAAVSGSNAGVGVGVGLGVGMIVGLAVVFLFRPGKNGWAPDSRPGGEQARLGEEQGEAKPEDEDPLPVRGVAGGFAGGVLAGVVTGYLGHIGFGHTASIVSGLPVALGVGLAVGACGTFRSGLAGGFVGGFLAGFLEGVGKGPAAGVINGLGVTLIVAWIAKGVGRDTPARDRNWSWRFGIPGGLIVGAAVGIIAGFEKGSAIGLLAGVTVGALSSWPLGLVGVKTKRDAIPAPRTALHRDIGAFWKTGFSAGIAAAAVGFFGDGVASVFEVHTKLTVHTLVTDGLGIGISSGIIVGLTFGVYHATSPSFLICRIWLTARGDLPWRFMDFLADAHQERGVLRQNGAVYEFRHVELLRYLARTGKVARSVGKQPPWTTVRGHLGDVRVRLQRSSP